jgi:hypothetical protein
MNCKELQKYKIITHFDKIRIGTYIRWTKKEDPLNLTLGGFITNVTVDHRRGKYIHLYNKFTKSTITLTYDDSLIIYQKLTDIELLINQIQMNFVEKNEETTTNS